MPKSFVALITVLSEVPEAPGASPPGIWGGGNVPMPNPPIANVPGVPGYQPPAGSPPGIWGPPGPWPTPPIQLPWWLLAGLQPPGIWGGGGVPMPNPPIANVPGAPGFQPPLHIWGPPDMPPGFWGGGMGPGVKPQPPMPSEPPTDLPPGGGMKPPPEDGGWGYHPVYGWGYFPAGGGKPQPGAPAAPPTTPVAGKK